MEKVFARLNSSKWEINLLTYRQWNRSKLPKKTWGLCDRCNKKIFVRCDLSKQAFLDTLLHELIHAENEILFEAEETVTRMGTDISKALLATERVFVITK